MSLSGDHRLVDAKTGKERYVEYLAEKGDSITLRAKYQPAESRSAVVIHVPGCTIKQRDRQPLFKVDIYHGRSFVSTADHELLVFDGAYLRDAGWLDVGHITPWVDEIEALRWTSMWEHIERHDREEVVRRERILFETVDSVFPVGNGKSYDVVVPDESWVDNFYDCNGVMHRAKR